MPWVDPLHTGPRSRSLLRSPPPSDVKPSGSRRRLIAVGGTLLNLWHSPFGEQLRPSSALLADLDPGSGSSAVPANHHLSRGVDAADPKRTVDRGPRRPGDLPSRRARSGQALTVNGRIMSLSSCSTMWQW